MATFSNVQRGMLGQQANSQVSDPAQNKNLTGMPNPARGPMMPPRSKVGQGPRTVFNPHFAATPAGQAQMNPRMQPMGPSLRPALEGGLPPGLGGWVGGRMPPMTQPYHFPSQMIGPGHNIGGGMARPWQPPGQGMPAPGGPQPGQIAGPQQPNMSSADAVPQPAAPFQGSGMANK